MPGNAVTDSFNREYQTELIENIKKSLEEEDLDSASMYLCKLVGTDENGETLQPIINTLETIANEYSLGTAITIESQHCLRTV